MQFIVHIRKDEAPPAALRSVQYVVTPELELPAQVGAKRARPSPRFPAIDTIAQIGEKFDVPKWLMRSGEKNRPFRTVPYEFSKLPSGLRFQMDGSWLAVHESFNAWDTRCKTARTFANRVEETWSPHLKALIPGICESFVTEAEYLGWRKALSMFFGRSTEVTTFEEVVAWARVQQRCCLLYAERKNQCIEHFFIDEGDAKRIRDFDSFRLAYPLLYQLEIQWKPWFKLVNKLGLGFIGDDVRPWEEDGRYYSGAWEMSGASACREIIRRGWGMIRALQGKLRPAEPESAKGPLHVIRELDKIILWCEQQIDVGEKTNTGTVVTSAKKTSRPTRQEYNQLAREYLKRRPSAGAAELSKALKCGVGTVYKLPAFQAVRGEIEKGKKPKVVSLTAEMAAAVSRENEIAKLAREQRRDQRQSRVLSGDRE